MRMAFEDVSVSPDEIDYINAHGTSTPLGNASETRAIKRAVGDERARRIPISSPKGATRPTAAGNDKPSVASL
jgi:3-oxoacyl-[acyl-carrier-protein] synthase II